jgi:hypothetical protein
LPDVDGVIQDHAQRPGIRGGDARAAAIADFQNAQGG